MSGADLLNFSSKTANEKAKTTSENRQGKSAGALRTISEVSEILDIPQHVLRFWETKFQEITPLKRNGGRRFYRPADIEVLQQIKFLLYKQGYTIKGAKKAIEDYAKVLSTTMAQVGKPRIEQTAKQANQNDNKQPATSADSNRRTLDVSLGQAALGALRADLIEAHNTLATKLGKSLV
jgi:DNA-binding transcriptional MerR regulator